MSVKDQPFNKMSHNVQSSLYQCFPAIINVFILSAETTRVKKIKVHPLVVSLVYFHKVFARILNVHNGL